MTKQLLFSVTAKDCRMDVFRAGGKGGQHQNKTSSAVRFTHIASGAVGESREERSQLQNKQLAWKRMAQSKEFQLWNKKETARRLGLESAIEKSVESQMQERYIRTEVHDEDGRWVEAQELAD